MLVASEPIFNILKRFERMKSSKPCVLVGDDQPEIRKMIKVVLTRNQFKIIEASNGEEILRMAASHKPDVILLDLSLPDVDGTEVLKRLREWSNVPVVVISERFESHNIVQAFELGADDYMTKPFDLDILMARIKAAIKHTFQKELGNSTLQAGSLEINLVRHEVTLEGQVVDLSPKEYELLSFLMQHQGKMLTHRQILKAIWGEIHSHDKQYLRVYIMQLRQKIETKPEEPEFIMTESGIGYRFDAPVTQQES